MKPWLDRSHPSSASESYLNWCFKSADNCQDRIKTTLPSGLPKNNLNCIHLPSQQQFKMSVSCHAYEPLQDRKKLLLLSYGFIWRFCSILDLLLLCSKTKRAWVRHLIHEERQKVFEQVQEIPTFVIDGEPSCNWPESLHICSFFVEIPSQQSSQS